MAVSRPTRWPSNISAMPAWISSWAFKPTRRGRRSAASKASRPMNPSLSRLTKSAQTRLVGHHRGGHVGTVVEDARLDAADVHARHGGEAQTVPPAHARQVFPQSTMVGVVGHVEFEPHFARPAGAGREQGFARHGDPGPR